VYLTVLEYMKEGARKFVDFTNEWKGRLADTAPQFRQAKPVPIAEIPSSIPAAKYSRITAKRLAIDGAEAQEYKPQLPSPPRETGTRQIRFTRPITEIVEIARSLLGDDKAEPKDVGEACFDRVLRDIRKPKKQS
jgi:hypothetical protein